MGAYGQFGDGTIGAGALPVTVTGLAGMTAAAGVGRQITLAYTYDRLYRLTGVTAPEGTTSYR